MAERWGLGPFRREGPARVARGERGGAAGGEGVTPVQVIKPSTYMNRSGAVLAPLRADEAFDPERDLLVLVDDVALAVGRFRLRPGGSAGGHNGLRSIEGALRSQAWARLRIGVGPRPHEVGDLADYVLDRFTQEEYAALAALLDPMAEAVECWLDQGIEAAMNQFNR